MEEQRNQVKNYRDLIVWKEAILLVKAVYAFTTKFPTAEQYGLTSQMRRAAVSIPSNIAEGKSRGTGKDFKHFLTIAFGSGAELETQIIISKELGYLDEKGCRELIEKLDYIQRMLNKFIFSLKT